MEDVMTRKSLRQAALALVSLICLAAPKAAAEGAAPRPLFLVHGWGPPAIVGFNEYVGFLKDDGFPASRIHVLKYSFTSSIAVITRQLTAQINAVLAKYPA